MILDCLTCHRPIAAQNGQRPTSRYQVWAVCGSCGAQYLVTVELKLNTKLEPPELDARRNRTT